MEYRYFRNHIFRQIIFLGLFALCLVFLYDGIFVKFSTLEIILSSATGAIFLGLSIIQFIKDRGSLCVKDLDRIITETTKSIVSLCREEKTPIKYYTHFGAIHLDAANLTIWYFFETDEDLKLASENGLVERIRKSTKSKMIENRYPSSAFESNTIPVSPKIWIENGSEKANTEIVHALTHRRVGIAFSSQEDVQNKADGNYFLYLKLSTIFVRPISLQPEINIYTPAVSWYNRRDTKRTR